MNVMGVDFIAPVMMRSAWFCILSRDCWLVFAVVDHAVELYSCRKLHQGKWLGLLLSECVYQS